MKKTIIKLLLVIDVLAAACFFTAYGPFPFFRNWLVTTALTTSSHSYLAYILYTPEMIEEIMQDNQSVIVEDDTDLSLIDLSGPKVTEYASEYEREILENPEGAPYKIIELNENGYVGWVTVIYEPERLKLAVSETDRGQKVTTMARSCDALVDTNAGGFTLGRGNKSADGGMIADGELVKESDEKESLIAFTDRGQLLLTYDTVQNLAERGDIDWALYFTPFLIVNGQRSTFNGNAGGQQPRTAIGQRADGIVLLVTIEGRGASGSWGINYGDLTDIFERYGCLNAANLDGGGSSVLAINGELVNTPRGFGKSEERKVYNALVYY